MADLPLHPACRLLKADASGLLAADKAEGILSHPNPGQDKAPSLLGVRYDGVEECYVDGDQRWYLLNRLDGPTSGVILLADNCELALAVKEAFASHNVEKTYAAVIRGFPPRRKDRWRDCLQVVKRKGVLRTAVIRGRPNAETAIELLQRGEGPPARSLVALHPKTGRTHQLRVQCASRHLAIIGDATYGDFAFNRDFRQKTGLNRLFLHSWKRPCRCVWPDKNSPFPWKARSRRLLPLPCASPGG